MGLFHTGAKEPLDWPARPPDSAPDTDAVQAGRHAAHLLKAIKRDVWVQRELLFHFPLRVR